MILFPLISNLLVMVSPCNHQSNKTLSFFNKSKKIKNVFINYCKLNNTVYQKITQHQINTHSQTNKLQNLSNSIQRKFNDTLKQVKQMYQQMKYQTLRTKNLVDQAVKPISQAMNKKVDQQSFTMHMKRIMAQLDQDQLSQTQLSQLNTQNNPLLPQDLSIRKRKGKSVSQQQYEQQKQKNLKLFLELSSKIQQLQIKNQQFSPIIYKNSSLLNKLNLTVDNHQTQIFKLNRDIKQIRTMINNSQQRLINQINSKTNDHVWQTKLNSFQFKNIIPKFQNLYNQINKHHKQYNRHFANLQPKFLQINQNIQLLNDSTSKNHQQIQNINHSLKQMTQKLNQQLNLIQSKLNVVYNQKKVKIQKIHQKIDSQINQRAKQIQNLNHIIKDLSKTIQDKVLVGVRKNLDVKIHQIDKNIHSLTNKQKSLQQQLLTTKGEIYNIKQVLSKKANFTDILIHFERKADKQDFKQLKDKIEYTAPSHLKSTILDSPQKTCRTISANSRKRSSLSKNIINPVNILNEDKLSIDSQIDRNDRSNRLFIMGLESEMGFNNDRRRMSYTQSTRRKKKMKSTNGLLNLFANN